MRSWVLAAGLLAAAAASPALAADIDGVPPPPRNGPYGAPYEDPRYTPKGTPPSYYDDEEEERYDRAPPAKRYSNAPPKYAAPPPDDDDEPYNGPGPNGPRDYNGPPPAKKYSNTPPKYAAPPPGKGCVRSEQVRERLTGDGWRDFHDGQPVSDTLVTLRARRPSGRLFELTLDRCSGEIVEARPLQLRPFGPYAYREPYGPFGPWRWGPERAPYADEGPWQERPYAYRGPRRWYGD